MTRNHWIAATAGVALIVGAVIYARTKRAPNYNPVTGRIVLGPNVTIVPTAHAVTHAGSRL